MGLYIRRVQEVIKVKLLHIGRYDNTSIVIKNVLGIHRFVNVPSSIQTIIPIRFIVALAAKGRIHRRLRVGRKAGSLDRGRR